MMSYEIINIIISTMLVFFTFLTLFYTIRYNKKTQFVQLMTNLINDNKFTSIKEKIEIKMDLKKDGHDFDYFLECITLLLKTNKKLTIKFFSRELFIITFIESYYEYIESLSQKPKNMVNGIYYDILKLMKIIKKNETKKLNIPLLRDFDVANQNTNFYVAVENCYKCAAEKNDKKMKS